MWSPDPFLEAGDRCAGLLFGNREGYGEVTAGHLKLGFYFFVWTLKHLSMTQTMPETGLQGFSYLTHSSSFSNMKKPLAARANRAYKIQPVQSTLVRREMFRGSLGRNEQGTIDKILMSGMYKMWNHCVDAWNSKQNRKHHLLNIRQSSSWVIPHKEVPSWFCDTRHTLFL